MKLKALSGGIQQELGSVKNRYVPKANRTRKSQQQKTRAVRNEVIIHRQKLRRNEEEDVEVFDSTSFSTTAAASRSETRHDDEYVTPTDVIMMELVLCRARSG